MIERKFLAHYLDDSFGGTTAHYNRIGKDLEEYGDELNPDVETKNNIWGEQSVNHKGYQVQSEVDPYYAEEGDALYEKLEEIVNKRLTGDDCKTTKIDVLVNANGEVQWAYKEDVYVIPNSLGGDASGYQIPYTIYNAGNRVDVTNNVSFANGGITYSTSGSGSGSGGGVG